MADSDPICCPQVLVSAFSDESVMVIDMQVVCAVRNYGYLFRL